MVVFNVLFVFVAVVVVLVKLVFIVFAESMVSFKASFILEAVVFKPFNDILAFSDVSFIVVKS